MYTIKSVILLFISLYAFISCNNNENVASDIKNWHLYYASDYLSYEKISENDTIVVVLGDSISLFVRTEEEHSSIGVTTSNDIEVTTTDENEYKFYAKSAGIATVIVRVADDYSIFYIYIKPFNRQFTVYEYPVYQIDVDNENLIDPIRSELNTYAPNYLDVFKLRYIDSNNGYAELIIRPGVVPSDTIKGLFTDDKTNISMSFSDNSSYNFTVTEYEGPSLSCSHYLIQDFTDTFRSKYPSEQIHEVTILSGVQQETGI